MKRTVCLFEIPTCRLHSLIGLLHDHYEEDSSKLNYVLSLWQSEADTVLAIITPVMIIIDPYGAGQQVPGATQYGTYVRTSIVYASHNNSYQRSRPYRELPRVVRSGSSLLYRNVCNIMRWLMYSTSECKADSVS